MHATLFNLFSFVWFNDFVLNFVFFLFENGVCGAGGRDRAVGIDPSDPRSSPTGRVSCRSTKFADGRDGAGGIVYERVTKFAIDGNPTTSP